MLIDSRQMTFGVTVVLALLTYISTANAADLDGDCCADLEERIAELEATAARKGNRKVSLTISGYISKQVMYWDDGVESNTYVSDMGPTQTSHFKLNGQAQIAPGWTAGYLIRLQDLSINPQLLNQLTDEADQGLGVQMSHWYLQNKDLGKVAVGLNAQAAKSAVMFTDQSGTQVIANYVTFDGAGFRLRDTTNALSPVTWGNLGFCYSQARPWGGDCNGIIMDGVRYDSPTFAGFSASASWGEDDFWEVAGRYSGELGGFKIAAALGYSVNHDEREKTNVFVTTKNTEYLQVGGYIQHLASGLFVHGAYGQEDNNGATVFRDVNTNGIFDAGDVASTAQDGEHWYVKAGIRHKWSTHGHTVLWGDYARYEDQLGPVALALGATSSEFDRWGFGIAQEIDAAAMTVWLKYKKNEADVDGIAALSSVEDINFIHMGAILSF